MKEEDETCVYDIRLMFCETSALSEILGDDPVRIEQVLRYDQQSATYSLYGPSWLPNSSLHVLRAANDYSAGENFTWRESTETERAPEADGGSASGFGQVTLCMLIDRVPQSELEACNDECAPVHVRLLKRVRRAIGL